MEIKKGVLISVNETDLENGVFYNDKVVELADKCFNNVPSLVKVVLPKCKIIGNDCLSYNDKFTTLTAPALTTIGNDCLRSNASFTTLTAPALTTIGDYCLRSNASFTTLTIGKKQLDVRNVDGYCFVIESKKTSKGIKIYTGYNLLGLEKKVIKKQECFVSEKDNFFAHGETVKKSIQDLQFKIVAEKIKKEPIKKDTRFDVQYYRLLTGACDMGCRDFMIKHKLPYDILQKGTLQEETIFVDSNKTKTTISAFDLFKILEKDEPDGFEKFKSLINW